MSLGPFTEEVANIANRLATIESGNGHLDEATALYEAALYIRRRVLGGSDPAVAKTLHNLALVHERAEQTDRAAELWDQAASIAMNARVKESLAESHDTPDQGLSRRLPQPTD